MTDVRVTAIVKSCRFTVGRYLDAKDIIFVQYIG